MPSRGRERLIVDRQSLTSRPVVRPRLANVALAWAWGLAIAASSAPAVAASTGQTAGSPGLGPRAGAGQRAVDVAQEPGGAVGGELTGSTGSSATASAGSGGAAKTTAPVSHRRGPAPKQPLATLPPGAARAPADAAARRRIAGGATRDELRAGGDDPELRALRAAEQVLFPRPLPGATSGWSWGLTPATQSREPELLDSGLPPSERPRVAVTGQRSDDAAWLRTLQLPNLPVRLDGRVIMYLKLYRDSTDGQAIARAWAKKSGRYTSMLKATLAQAGLPTDLVWLSLIESGHNATIRSPAGAAGLWQFMPETGRTYGLTVDRWVDERLDPKRSTEAAVALLGDLHERFGNWELAMAAYNMGHGGLVRAIRKYNSNDFWELSRLEAGLPWETTLYVPKILALAIVMNNRKAFGIDGIEPEPAETFDTVMVDPGVELRTVANAAGTDVSSCARLNPAFLSGRTPPAAPGRTSVRWAVHVPTGTAATVERRLGRSQPAEALVSYTSKFGDTVSAVAVEHSKSTSELRRVNDLRSNEALAAGTVVLLPQGSSPTHAPPEDPVVVVPDRALRYPGRRRVFYRVVSGDSLTEIASAFSVSADDLVAWNSLDTTARLQSGMTLQLFVPSSAPLEAARYLKEPEAKVLVVGTDEFYEHFEAQNGKKRMTVVARGGETLGSIGQRYGMSAGLMERVNRRSRRDGLEPGERVVVYAPMAATDQSVAETAAGDRSREPVDPPRPDALPPYDSASPQTAGASSRSGG